MLVKMGEMKEERKNGTEFLLYRICETVRVGQGADISFVQCYTSGICNNGNKPTKEKHTLFSSHHSEWNECGDDSVIWALLAIWFFNEFFECVTDMIFWNRLMEFNCCNMCKSNLFIDKRKIKSIINNLQYENCEQKLLTNLTYLPRIQKREKRRKKISRKKKTFFVIDRVNFV